MKLPLRVKRPPVPTEPNPETLDLIKSLGHACTKCAEAAGAQDKTVVADLSYDDASAIDAATWSRIKAGGASPSWDTLDALMDACGNEIPLLWMLHKRGYDPRRLHRYESDLERENRRLKEQLAQERAKNDVIIEFVREARRG